MTDLANSAVSDAMGAPPDTGQTGAELAPGAHLASDPSGPTGAPSWLRRRRPWLIAGGVVVLLAGTGVGVWLGTSGGSGGGPTITVTTVVVTVTTGTMKQYVSATGTVEPAEVSDLNFAVSGVVTAVDVSAGQTVSAGQVLASVAPTALAAQEAAAQAAVTSAQSKLTSDEDDGASTSTLASDRASLTSSKDQLTTAQKNLTAANLVSPIAGVVASVGLTVGEQVGGAHGSGTSSGGSGSQVEVVSASNYIVNSTVDDTEVAEVHNGDQAVITLTTSTSSGTGGGRFSFGPGASVGRSSSTPAATTSSGSSTAKIYGTVASVSEIASGESTVASFPVVVNVTGSPAGVYAGAGVTVTLLVKQLNTVVEVPAAALIDTGGSQHVTLVEATGHHVTQAVTTGITQTGEIQVTKGLAAGDKIVEQERIFSTPTGAVTSGTLPGRGTKTTFSGPGGGSFLGGGSRPGGGTDSGFRTQTGG